MIIFYMAQKGNQNICNLSITTSSIEENGHSYRDIVVCYSPERRSNQYKTPSGNEPPPAASTPRKAASQHKIPGLGALNLTPLTKP